MRIWNHRICVIFLGISSVLFFGLGVLIFSPIQLLIWRIFPFSSQPLLGAKIRKLWANFLLKCYGIEVEVTGEGKNWLSLSKPMVIVMNHQSALDILVNIAMLPTSFVFLAKKELLRIPVFGWAGWMTGIVYIDRKRGIQDTDALDAVRKALKRGRSILIYPEGTRSKTHEMLPFKRGAFVLAISTSTPILPVTVLNTSELMLKHSLQIRSGRVQVVIDPPVEVNGLGVEDRYQLASDIRDRMAKNLDLYRSSQRQ